MTDRNIMMTITPWPSRITVEDSEHSRMEPEGALAYMLTVEGAADAGAQAITIRDGVASTAIGPFDADQLRELGRTLIRTADDHDRLLARFRDSDDVLGLRARTVGLCGMAIRS